MHSVSCRESPLTVTLWAAPPVRQPGMISTLDFFDVGWTKPVEENRGTNPWGGEVLMKSLFIRFREERLRPAVDFFDLRAIADAEFAPFDMHISCSQQQCA
jgi:hypothetical protein